VEVVRSAVVLLSGGLDSTITLAIAREQGYQPYALTFDYGQRHRAELDAAREIAKRYRVAEHVIVELSPRFFAGSALTSDVEVPKGRALQEIGAGIPVTYVPARNTIFLSYALAWAEILGASDIFIGVNALDYSGYPDCRPEYVSAFQEMANLATRAGVQGRKKLRIHTPLIRLGKGDIVRKGIELGVDFGLTRTCYEPSSSGEACGVCDACLLRLKGFAESGMTDPAPYCLSTPASI
jgi:7-cyano-7-deazaguanine synthase